MFSLFYGLWNHVFSKTEFRLLILGVHKAGKTTLLEKLKSIYLKGEGLPHDRVVPTVGLNIGRIEDANVKLVFWYLGGQDLPTTVTEEELDRHFHLKEFDERPYMFVAGSAYDGVKWNVGTWRLHSGCFQGKMFALPHCFTKKKDACPHSFCDIITSSG
ncbi:uncharacterized protein [Lolium perenne]|uniref:uncharacterized protein n=1 Tax=Lolium perenne TaxID=4522 RepID=UPI0021F5955E|nr:uncharacterized protein LOC127301372 [Lolium perenne]